MNASSGGERCRIHPRLLAQADDHLPQQLASFRRQLARIHFVHAPIITYVAYYWAGLIIKSST